MKSTITLTILSFFIIHLSTSQQLKSPTFEEIISLRSFSNPGISPSGDHIVFTSNTVDWKENRYDTEIWISKNGNEPFQLTNNPKHSSYNPKWSPDGNWIAFISTIDEKSQLFAIRVSGGESFQITSAKEGINNFEWSPDGKRIAFLQSEDKSEEQKKRKDKYGSFAVEDAEYVLKRLWLMDFDPARFIEFPLPQQVEDSIYNADREPELVMDSVDFTINKIKWSPDGKKIAFEHQPDPLINTYFKADISIYDVDSETHKILVSNRSYDGLIEWSPDGNSILYSTSMEDTLSNYYKNSKLFRINTDGTENKQLAKAFDENINITDWNQNGIFGIAWQKTKRIPILINPDNGKYSSLNTPLERVWGMSFSKNAEKVAFNGVGDHDLSELYYSDYPIKDIRKITNASAKIESWSVANSEVISWKSEDGAKIEGVLFKPYDYDAGKKYPLMVIIHGGPTGISIPSPTPSYVYPIVQWLNKGALILMPNYRGSTGYGEDFRSLNVKNLGVGDAWDVLAGVEHLEKEGVIDANKVAAMGWSQGGYISAFLTTNSNRFKAISVGAGISNWVTYYVNTDIHPFTRQYLKADPWSDKSIYEKTSPMTNIKNASTPTLIQHGEFDKRVPVANAYELFQGLQDVGVETKLIIYKGFGHGINKPKEQLAATWHNWQWINKYIWGEEVILPEK